MTANPRRRKEILERAVGPDKLLYDTANKTVHVLNGSADFLWQRCDGSRNLEEIAEEAASTFGESLAVVSADLHQCLQSFESLALIEQD